VNGVHDMGGRHGAGPVAPEADEPVFHNDWERRVHAMVLASPTRGNIDAGRHRRELIPPAEYLRMSYYERWLEGLCAMLLDGGAVTAAELDSGRADRAAAKGKPRLAAPDVTAALTRQGSYVRQGPAPAFQPGERVRTRNMHPLGHTRLPWYARDKEGVVERLHGAHVFPDSHAHGRGEDPRPLYRVRFSARTLWGADAPERDSVSLDLWEPYLERA
jgi:nitrile hydratase